MRRARFALLLGLLMLPACQRAQRYPLPAPADVSQGDKESDADLLRASWCDQPEQPDVPIVFIAEGHPDWALLGNYWNAVPFPGGMPTIHLALPPLGAISALVLAEQMHEMPIRIKVPRGLPDPTPHIPAANPPTLGKWRLGKTLFFKPILKAGDATYACATCHNPRHGFAEDKPHPEGGRFKTLSLLNAVYNRRQFWDGRVAALEETLVRSFEDERNVKPEQGRQRALEQHIWGGMVRALAADSQLKAEFKRVFGIDEPTQNAAAQALATYVRTLLSGDSLFDRAEALRRVQAAKELGLEHFRGVLKDEGDAAGLRDDPTAKEPTLAELAPLLQQGHALFFGKAGCAACHRGPLFADHDYHNVGYAGLEGAPAVGVETGRSLQVPVGLKEWRLVGAYRTPGLRSVSRTAPYFHDGSQADLFEVVEFFNSKVLPSFHLAAALKDPEAKEPLTWPRRLNMSDGEKAALVVFMRSLQGRPMDAMLLPPAK